MTPVPLSREEFKNLAIKDNTLILDTRNKDEFAKGFIRGSLFIGLGDLFKEWAVKLIPKGSLLLLVCEKGTEGTLYDLLNDAGFSKIAGHLNGGFATWSSGGETIDMVVNIDAEEFAMDIPFDPKMVIIDVRSEEAYSKSHVKDAINLPLDQLNDSLMIGSLEETDNIYLHCGGGYRSLIAASLLKKEDVHNVRNIIGGFKAIQQVEKIPLVNEINEEDLKN